MNGLLVCYLGCMFVNINALFAEWGITEQDYFQILRLGILSGMEYNRYLISDVDAVTATFNVLDRQYIFSQFQTCSADYPEGSCSSNIPSNFYQLFSF